MGKYFIDKSFAARAGLCIIERCERGAFVKDAYTALCTGKKNGREGGEKVIC
jgi:hypothetical protein